MSVLGPYYTASASLSLIAAIFVVYSYIKFKEVRKHPSSLIFWRSIFDLFFSLQFIVLYAWSDSEDHCMVLSLIFQFTVLGTQSYYVMVALDLFLAIRDPFTNSARNLKFYHSYVWITSTLTCIVLIASSGTGYRRGMEVCWIKQTDELGDVNILNWILFFVPTLIYYAVTVAIVINAMFRLNKGLAETFKIRQQVLKNGQRYVTVFCLYWTAAAAFYLKIYLLEAEDDTVKASDHKEIYGPFAILLGLRGFIDVVVWTVNQGVINTYRRYFAGDPPLDAEFTDINRALRREVILFSTQGIVESLDLVSSDENMQEPGALYYPKHLYEYDNENAIHCLKLVRDDTERLEAVPFFDYAPYIFQLIREHLQIDSNDYRRSILGDTQMMVEKFTEGASGSFFYFSTDGNYLVKTLSKNEADTLLELLPAYYEYVSNNPDSLINKFVGFHAIKLYTYEIYFVSMQSVFRTNRTIHEKYDLKGSWIDRSTHGRRSVYKDNDLNHTVSMRNRDRRLFLTQVEKDSKFLMQHGIMDYSLLLGVHNTRQLVVRPDESVNIHDIELNRVPFYQEFDGGMQAKIIVGPGVYYFGIIDVLQTWNGKKKCERCLKLTFKCKDADGISAINPIAYQKRFMKAMNYITEPDTEDSKLEESWNDRLEMAALPLKHTSSIPVKL